MSRRTPEQIFSRRRSLEGGDFERYAVAGPLEAAGHTCARSHRSRGPFDWVALAPGRVLVVAARLTRVPHNGAAGPANPEFSAAELAALWHIAAGLSAPGMAAVPLLATARHAAAPGTLCRCAGAEPDPARFLRLLGPPNGAGRRRNWEPWEPEAAEPGRVPAAAR